MYTISMPGGERFNRGSRQQSAICSHRVDHLETTVTPLCREESEHFGQRFEKYDAGFGIVRTTRPPGSSALTPPAGEPRRTTRPELQTALKQSASQELWFHHGQLPPVIRER
jgi:hypothetical protein